MLKKTVSFGFLNLFKLYFNFLVILTLSFKKFLLYKECLQ